MAGHSKWANIKHRKARQDASRGKIWTKVIREITVAAKDGPDPADNPRLRLALEKANSANMPKDTIERTIKKASGADGTSYEEVTFEGYASNGVAVFVECTTDNNNRTVANIRATFSKYGGNLGTNGSLEFIFDRKGVFAIALENMDLEMEEFEMELIDAGLEEMEKEEDIILVYTDFADFSAMQKKLEELSIEVQSAELQRIPTNNKTLDVDKSKSVLKMIDKFEEDEDVQQVFHNMEQF